MHFRFPFTRCILFVIGRNTSMLSASSTSFAFRSCPYAARMRNQTVSSSSCPLSVSGGSSFRLGALLGDTPMSVWYVWGGSTGNYSDA